MARLRLRALLRETRAVVLWRPMRSTRQPNATFGSAATAVVSAAAILWYAWPRRPPHIVAWDVFGYYLYLPLFFIRGDLGLSDPAWVHDLIARYQNTATFYQAIPLGNGNMVLKYSMGMAVLYSPFFFIGHGIAILTGQPLDGLSPPYEWAMFAGSLTYTFTGLMLLRALLLRFFSDGIAAAVILLIALGTNYFATNAVTLAMSHVPLFTLYCALLLVTMDWHRAPTPGRSVALGALIGLMGLARPSEVVAAVIPVLWGVNGWSSLRERVRTLIIDRWREVALASGTAIAVGLPQVVYWKTYTGRFLFYSYVNPGEGFDFLHPYLAEVLFSFRKGWYIYTPLMAVATLGFFPMARRRRDIFVPLFVFFLLNLYVVSSWSNWWYAQSFGQRALVQSYPVMAVALGFALTALSHQAIWKQALAALLLASLFFLNHFQMWQMHRGILDGSRMTRAYFFKTFLRTSVDREARKDLLIERSFTGVEHFEHPEDYIRGAEWNQGFEEPAPLGTHAVRGVAHDGAYSFALDQNQRFSPALSIPFHELTPTDHAWLRVSAWVYLLTDVREARPVLVATFDHRGGAYKARSVDLAQLPEPLRPATWNEITLDYLTPEARRPTDTLRVYAWLRGSGQMYVDDVRVTSYVPRRRQGDGSGP